MTVIILIASVLLGSVLGIFFSRSNVLPRLLLTFSGAFLLTVTVLEIFPNIYASGHSLQLGLFVLLGVFIQILLEAVTKGAEHGHFHFHGQQEFPLAIFGGLFIHAFIEGMPIHGEDHQHLLTAIVIHKIPVALVLYLFIAKMTKDWKKQFLFMTLFALASPAGWLLGERFSEEYLLPVLAVVAGIFLHISTVIIFESSDAHKLKMRKLAALIAGFLLAWFTLHQH